MKYNLVAIAVNIARIYEIAKVGGFTVELLPASNVDDRPISSQDFRLINDFFSFGDPGENPDIIAELAFDHSDIMRTISVIGNRCETIDQINERIDKHRLSDLQVDRTISGASEALLKKAVDKLNLGICETFKIIDIAEVIAKMEDSAKIKPEHIAEAIQYKSIR